MREFKGSFIKIPACVEEQHRKGEIMQLKGIDVSEHQGVIDWSQVKQSGIQFVMIRAGYGQNNIDKQFYRNIEGCNDHGIPCGVYWFSYAYSAEMAQAEAKYCLQALEKYRIHYPVCYDLEYDTVSRALKNGVVINKNLATKMVAAFCGKIKSAGYHSMYYANTDYITNMLDRATLSEYEFWYAYYNKNQPTISGVNMWQYSSSGRQAGITGDVDINISYKDYAAITPNDGSQETLAKPSPAPRPSPAPTPSPTPTPTPSPVTPVKNTSVWVKTLQIQLNQLSGAVLVVDGIPGPKTLAKCPLLKRGSKGTIVRLVQQHYGMATGELDGIFGDKTTAQTKAYQKANSLVADGIIGKATWSKLLGLS